MIDYHNQIKAVFFDVVGTVLFPEPSAISIYAEVAHRAGLEISVADIRTNFIRAYDFEEKIDRYANWVTSEQREQQRWRSIVAASFSGVSEEEACFQELYQHFAKPRSWRLGEDVGPVIAALIERGIGVGLGSNYDSRLWTVLEGFPELAPLRERTIISSVVGHRKPAPKFFQHVIGVSGCNPREILFVGDDLANDYSGAIAAGMEARLLDPSNKMQVADRIERLMDIIESLTSSARSPWAHHRSV